MFHLDDSETAGDSVEIFSSQALDGGGGYTLGGAFFPSLLICLIRKREETGDQDERPDNKGETEDDLGQ